MAVFTKFIRKSREAVVVFLGEFARSVLTKGLTGRKKSDKKAGRLFRTARLAEVMGSGPAV